MKTIEASGTIEQERRLVLDEPLPAGVSGRVRLLILVGDDELNERDWMRAAMQGGSFEFLNAPEEDTYTLEDGKRGPSGTPGCRRDSREATRCAPNDLPLRR